MRSISPNWSVSEDSLLLEICKKRRPFGKAGWIRAAAEFPGRTAEALRHRFTTLEKHSKGIVRKRAVRPDRPPRRYPKRVYTMQEPTIPAALPEHTSLTAAFFGDPLPGRSALDRRPTQQAAE